jgi:hypothetical protein
MWKRWCIFALVTAFAATGCTRLPEGYEFLNEVAPVDASDLKTEGPFSVTIKREAWSSLHKDFLILAERIFPKQEIVAASAGEMEYGISEEEIAQAGEPLWWNRTYQGIRIPYTLTSSAVYYYRTLLGTLSKMDHYEEAHLAYTAVVDQKSEYEVHGEAMANVTLVIMQLSWQAKCGKGCSHAFDVERIVVFDTRQQVVAVLETPPALRLE